jgi:hypothetical protein
LEGKFQRVVEAFAGGLTGLEAVHYDIEGEERVFGQGSLAVRKCLKDGGG